MVTLGCVPATQWLHHEVATDQTCHLSHASDVMSREATMMQRHTPGGNHTLLWLSGNGGSGQAQLRTDMVAGWGIAAYASGAMSSMLGGYKNGNGVTSSLILKQKENLRHLTTAE